MFNKKEFGPNGESNNELRISEGEWDWFSNTRCGDPAVPCNNFFKKQQVYFRALDSQGI